MGSTHRRHLAVPAIHRKPTPARWRGDHTNTEGDWCDLVVLRPGPDPDQDYLSPTGPRPFERHRELIHVKDGQDHVLEVLSTIWGPVIDTDHRGHQHALRWVAHDREAVNMGLLRLETASTVEGAFEAAHRTGAPAQNLLVADAGGHIGWTILGPIPRRYGHDGRRPRSWADGSRGWKGWLTPAEYPRLIDPRNGRLWTANARAIGGEMLTQLGDGGYALGARARQIHDHLLAIEQADEAAMLDLQLDDRALFLERWRDLLLEVLTPQALIADPRRRELRQYVEDWGGRAAVDSVGFRIVRAFRGFLAEQVFGALTVKCRLADERFDYRLVNQREGPLWRLVEERPSHLLNPRYGNWREQYLAAVDALLDYFMRDGPSLEEYTWGRYNTSQIRHPLSQFIPVVGHWLDMPPIPLPGDFHMPRVQTPIAGASQRLVVSPGLEAQGIFHMPGGQSAHLLSPHYRDGHKAWVNGKPTPFLPGPAEHVLTLRPETDPKAF